MSKECNWYRVELDGKTIERIRLHQNHAPESVINYVDPNCHIKPLAGFVFATGRDELEAFMLVTKWIELGKPIARTEGDISIWPDPEHHGAT